MITGNHRLHSQRWVRAGANIIVWSRSQASIDKALAYLEAINDTKGKITGSRVDAGVEEQVQKALKEADEISGAVDILINGVGGNIGKSSLIETDMDTFQKVLHNNLAPAAVQEAQKNNHWKSMNLIT